MYASLSVYGIMLPYQKNLPHGFGGAFDLQTKSLYQAMLPLQNLTVGIAGPYFDTVL